MSHIRNLLVAVGVGAGLAYYFDPAAGKQRRGQLRDQLNQLATRANKMGHDADAKMRHLRNRAYGKYAETSSDIKDMVASASNSLR